MKNINLDRFIKAQEMDFELALKEIKSGKKESHWMWYIFPQMKGLGNSQVSTYYSIQDANEAKAYWDNEYLHNNLLKICNELLNLKTNDPLEVMGYPDNLKFASSMTLFHLVAPDEKIFTLVLDKYYNGKLDEKTTLLYNDN